MQEAKLSTLVPWYGSNRMLAPNVGRLFDDCTWVGVVFAGGMSEVRHMKARTIVVNDLHRHVMNLAAVLAIDGFPLRLAEQLNALPFHPDTLAAAQAHCEEMERGGWDFSNVDQELSERWALSYFIVAWMSRSEVVGTPGEFKGKLPLRWSASGGDSNVRYRSAIESLEAWSATMRRCTFSTLDWEKFLDKCKDAPRHGIYADPPFPGPGEKYRYTMSETQHRQLAAHLGSFKDTLVVCRFYDHPLVRELYPEDRWNWLEFAGRDSANNDKKPERLLINLAS